MINKKEKTRVNELFRKKKKLDINQFDKFWEIKCPKCHETIDLEILINHLKDKLEIKSKK